MTVQVSVRGVAVAMALLALGGRSVVTAHAQGSQDAARAQITQMEKEWVASVVSGKTESLARFVADDIVAVDFQGHVIDKATMLAEVKGAPKFFSANTLNGVNVRFFGDDFAVAQGSETFAGQNGMPKQGQFVFTDTWVKRNGAWQLVATQSVMPTEPSK